MYRILLILLSLSLIAAAPKRPVIVSIVPAAPPQIEPGATVEHPLELKILKGYHIQANPASEEYLIAVTVKLEPIEGITVAEPIYPPGVPFRLKGSQKDILTYEETARIRIPLQANIKVKPGDVVLKGTLRYQGCDDTMCFPPTNLPFEIKLKIVGKR